MMSLYSNNQMNIVNRILIIIIIIIITDDNNMIINDVHI
jgi:hypothetical protein